MLGKIEGGEEKGTTEEEMVGWHHQLNGHEFEQTLGEGQRSLACCSPWDFPGKSTGVGCHCLLRMTDLDSILKSTDITLPTKVHLVMYFSSIHVWM